MGPESCARRWRQQTTTRHLRGIVVTNGVQLYDRAPENHGEEPSLYLNGGTPQRGESNPKASTEEAEAT